MTRHLYVHIPFCPKICPYCSFYKETSDKNKTAEFLNALLKEAGMHSGHLRPETIFFGGGTPSALSTSQLEVLLSGLHNTLDLRSVKEWTLEMNPATVSLEKARMLLGLGVTRISMGIQAWQPRLLEVLGRVHSDVQARRSYEILREAGFENLNLDLIFGVPGQTLRDWRDSLEITTQLEPEHISCYCLTYEEDTAFFDSLQAGKFEVNEGLESEMFLLTREFLGTAGWPAYEVSNFSKPGRECRHNIAYWQGEDYLGLGPSAFSTVGARRWRNVRDTVRYTASTLLGGTEKDFTEALPDHTRDWEQLAFGLRMSEGIPTEGLPTGELENLRNRGYVEVYAGRCRITGEGWLVADAIAEALLP